jgi:hypothetical protein
MHEGHGEFNCRRRPSVLRWRTVSDPNLTDGVRGHEAIDRADRTA